MAEILDGDIAYLLATAILSAVDSWLVGAGGGKGDSEDGLEMMGGGW